MEFILIDKDKIKIILSEDDMIEYNIDTENFDYSDLYSKKIIHFVLDKARAETGFESRGTKLFIQLFASDKGGCELFISKIRDECINDDENIKTKSVTNNNFLFYIIVDFDTLCRLCERIYNKGLKYNTLLYFDNSSKYYLLFKNDIKLPTYYSTCECDFVYPPFLSEYGVIMNSDKTFLDYLDEHCRLIKSENAVETINSIFLHN